MTLALNMDQLLGNSGGSLAGYYDMQATAQNGSSGAAPMTMDQWLAMNGQQGYTRGSNGAQDMGDGLGGATPTNNFRLPDGNWRKPVIQNGMVVGYRDENIGLGERLRDGVESLAPMAAIVAGGAYAGAAGAPATQAATAGATGTAAPGLLSPMTMPAALGGGTTATLPVGTGTVLAGGAAAGGSGLLGQLGSSLGGNAGTILGGIAGGVGSAMEPSTLSSTSTASIDGASRQQIQDYIDAARTRAGQGANPLTQQAGDMVSRLAGDSSTVDNAVSVNNQRLQDGGVNAYSGSSPYLDEMLRRGTSDISRSFERSGESIDTTLARGGAFGGSAWMQRRADNEEALGDASANYINQARFADHQLQAQMEEARLGRQDSAISRAPQLDVARYTGADAVSRIGQQQFDQTRANWTDYASAIPSVISGATRTTTQTGSNPNQSNPAASIVGGALLGNQLWNTWGR